jgi:hypothetical protein
VSSNLFVRTVGCQSGPTRPLQGDDADAFDTMASIAELNFTTIDNFVDGDVERDPYFYTRKADREVTISQALTILHNYLATIYSYTENLVEVLQDYLPESVRCPNTADLACTQGPNRSMYTKRFNFLLGLRTDAQHGTFSGFDVTSEHTRGSRQKHHVTFDRHGFVNASRLGDMNRYLAHTNARERRYLIAFMAKFHRHTFQTFHDDLLEWFDRAAN